MKRFCIFLCMFLSLALSFLSPSFFYVSSNKKTTINSSPNYNKFANAKAQSLTYAKVAPNCSLFKDSSLTENIDNILFVIPETYFVTIIETVSENAYKVQYGNYIGYINTLSVEIATFVPNIKILEGVTLDIKDSSGTQVWSKPSPTSAVLTTIPAGTKKITYIATAYGAIPSGGQSNAWYYVNFTPEYNSTSVYEGYVYSENVTNLTEILVNSECNPEIIPDGIKNTFDLYLSSPLKALIISIVAIPIIIFFLIVIYKFVTFFRSIKEKRIESANSKNRMEQIAPSIYENTNYISNTPNLKQEIENMNGKSFVRKINQFNANKSRPYPDFPSYESDDDWL